LLCQIDEVAIKARDDIEKRIAEVSISMKPLKAEMGTILAKVTELGSEDNESLVLAGKQHLLEHVRVEVLGVNNISSSHEVKLLFELVWEGLNIILTTKVELR